MLSCFREAEDVQNRAVEELHRFRGRLRALNLNVEQLTNTEVCIPLPSQDLFRCSLAPANARIELLLVSVLES